MAGTQLDIDQLGFRSAGALVLSGIWAYWNFWLNQDEKPERPNWAHTYVA